MPIKDTGVVNIHGKDYKTVAKRVDEFRKEHKTDFSIITSLINLDEKTVVMKAEILDKERNVIATGYAEENRTASQINRTSALENCETSAVGRALGNAGIGLDNGFASYEEVANAKKQQEDAKNDGEVKISNEQWKSLNRLFTKDEIKQMYAELGITNGKDIPMDYAVKKIEEYWDKFKKENPDKEFY